MGKRWIVLVNKSPKGPLSYEEINALIGQGLIRRNDLAYQVPEDPSSGTAEWKFLWQFDEFDRRKDEKLPTDPAQLSEIQKRRRPAPSAQEIKKEVSQALPDEFANIAIEELVVRSKKSGRLANAVEELENAEPVSYKGRTEEGSGKGWAIVATVCFLLAGTYIYKSKSGGGISREQDERRTQEPSRTPFSVKLPQAQPHSYYQAPQVPGPGPTAAIPNQAPPARYNQNPVQAITPPSAPEKGEVALDDYQRQREERLEKERREEEARLRAEQRGYDEEAEDEGQGEGGDGEGRPKAKLKKKRKPSNSSNSEDGEPRDREDRASDPEDAPREE